MPPSTADGSHPEGRNSPAAPPVLGPEYVGDAIDDPATDAGADEDGEQAPFPPVVYVPCSSTEPQDGQLLLDVRQLEDGRTALPVFSSTESLVRCCGPSQPWVAMPSEKLEGLDDLVGYDGLLLDVAIPEELRRG